MQALPWFLVKDSKGMSLPVISVEEMREWEKATWATGISAKAVITKVGRCLADFILSMTQPDETVLVLAGKGHNGDDVRAARKFLKHRKVMRLNVVEPKRGVLDFRKIIQKQSPGLVVDGLFGIGLNRPLNGDWIRLIDTINDSGVKILAMDVPSGLNAVTGKPEGAAIRAAVTLTVGAPKHGMLAESAWPYVGRLEVASDVGLVPCPARGELQWTMSEDFNNFPSRRPEAGHKGSFGQVTIIAGSLGYHGAAVLAARGALRAQPGLVTVFAQKSVYVPVASQMQAAMVHPWTAKVALPRTCSAVLAGPGLAAKDLPATLKKQISSLWKNSPLAMVADAGALEWLPPGATAKAIRVITPHPGEAARLLDVKTTEVQADRGTALRKLSKQYGNCFVVLKGHQTLAGCANGPIFVNPSGNAHLAQGGSGDLLGGYLAGLLAQPMLQKDVLKTIRLGVWAHGAAADRLQEKRNNWTVEDLVEELGR